MLSFAYSMLVREWTITLSAVGLDPYRGFYHQPRFGRPALSLDMMEPFRPLVAESTVLMAVNNGELSSSDFIHAAGSCNLKKAAGNGLSPHLKADEPGCDASDLSLPDQLPAAVRGAGSSAGAESFRRDTWIPRVYTR